MSEIESPPSTEGGYADLCETIGAIAGKLDRLGCGKEAASVSEAIKAISVLTEALRWRQAADATQAETIATLRSQLTAANEALRPFAALGSERALEILWAAKPEALHEDAFLIEVTDPNKDDELIAIVTVANLRAAAHHAETACEDNATLREALQAADFYPHKEALSELVHLLAEKEALNGGGPGYRERWDKALQNAAELVRIEP